MTRIFVYNNTSDEKISRYVRYRQQLFTKYFFNENLNIHVRWRMPKVYGCPYPWTLYTESGPTHVANKPQGILIESGEISLLTIWWTGVCDIKHNHEEMKNLNRLIPQYVYTWYLAIPRSYPLAKPPEKISSGAWSASASASKSPKFIYLFIYFFWGGTHIDVNTKMRV